MATDYFVSAPPSGYCATVKFMFSDPRCEKCRLGFRTQVEGDGWSFIVSEAIQHATDAGAHVINLSLAPHANQWWWSGRLTTLMSVASS